MSDGKDWLIIEWGLLFVSFSAFHRIETQTLQIDQASGDFLVDV
jgi:hypothetical protein